MLRSLILKLMFLVASTVLVGLVFSAFLPSEPRPRATPRRAKPRVRGVFGVRVNPLPLSFLLLTIVAISAALVVSQLQSARSLRGAAGDPASLWGRHDLWLADFEPDTEPAPSWRADGVTVTLIGEHVTHGRRAAQVTFPDQVEARLVIDVAAPYDARRGDWRPYEALSLDCFNPERSRASLTVRVVDARGRSSTWPITVDGYREQRVTLLLAKAAALERSRITRVELARATPGPAMTLVVDAVRLAASPQRHADAAQATPTPDERWALAFQRDPQRIVRVPVQVLSSPDLPLSARFPISGGVPFPMGRLTTDAPIQLVDSGNTRWPAQTRPMALWQDGSVKWLLVTTQVPPTAAGRQLTLDDDPAVTHAPEPTPRVTVEERPDAVTVTTGPLRFTINRQRFTLFESAAVDRNGDGRFAPEERLATAGDLVVRHGGTEYRSSLDRDTYRLDVEEAGPLRATLKASGWFRDPDGKGFCQFIVRFQAFAGLPQVRLYHTFIYTGYPENKQYDEYRGLTLPENETIQEMRLELPVDVTQRAAVMSADEQGTFTLPLNAPTTVAQLAHDAYRVQRASEPPLREGAHNEGWLLVQNAHAGVMVQVRDAWQQYPKALVADPAAKSITIQLWPGSAGALDLKTGPEAYGPDELARGSAFGLGKTHELMIGFLGAAINEDTARSIAQLWREPWLLFADPSWQAATKVWGPMIAPANPEQFPKAERMLADLFGWAERQPRNFHWYGMLDYGDTLLWYRKEAYDKSYDTWGWHPDGRWGWHNCEAICTHGGVLTSFIRTGSLPYFQFGEAHARHVMDVDTVHYNTVAHDPRLRHRISDAFSQVGSMHRHNAYHWGGRNEEATHTNVTGLLMYYYLTGYERAWDVINEVGGFLLRDPVTYRRHPHVAPGRAISNVFLGDVQLYEATWDPHYWRGAQRWLPVLLRGQQREGGWPETYNPLLRRWHGEVKNNYMALHILPALMTYHRLTGHEAVARAITLGTDWLTKTEPWLPFFDALAYSYLVTGKPAYLDEGRKRLDYFISVQRHVKDPLMDGMIFQRPIYDNVGPPLYAVPWILGALDAPTFAELGKR